MSNRIASPEALDCEAATAPERVFEAYPSKAADLGDGLIVRRALPRRGRRLVGPWCFLDHFGPLAFSGGKPMDVAPHPHIGLQTVTWLAEGEVLHKDSLGSEQVIRPGQLNLMTAGRGISHSEETPPSNSGRLHGLQLWVALPEAQRSVEPAFEHHASLPVIDCGAARATLLMGEFAGQRSPARAYSPILGAEIRAAREGEAVFPLDPAFEHAVFPVEGQASLDGRKLEAETLYYLGEGRARLSLQLGAGARLLLIGGAPFDENILMWWNFVARRPEEIAAAREDWMQRRRFGEVKAYNGARLEAPAFVGKLKRPE